MWLCMHLDQAPVLVKVLWTLQEQKRCVDGTLQREVKKVRKARNRRQEWNMMAFDKELRPDLRHGHTAHRGGSSEGSVSPENRWKDMHGLTATLLKKNKHGLKNLFLFFLILSCNIIIENQTRTRSGASKVTANTRVHLKLQYSEGFIYLSRLKPHSPRTQGLALHVIDHNFYL